MATVYHSDLSLELPAEPYSLEAAMLPTDALAGSPDDERFLLDQQHFHEFQDPGQSCDCGVSQAEYEAGPKSICPIVCDALFNPLPIVSP